VGLVNKGKMRIGFIDLVIEFLIVGSVDAVSFGYTIGSGGRYE